MLFADAGYFSRLGQVVSVWAAFVKAQVIAYKFARPFDFAVGAFEAVAALASAIKASAGVALNVFALVAARSSGSQEECAKNKRRKEKEFFAHVLEMFVKGDGMN